jgi:hypothetical protein
MVNGMDLFVHIVVGLIFYQLQQESIQFSKHIFILIGIGAE